MKIGDLVRYNSPDCEDTALGIIIKKRESFGQARSWVEVVWSSEEGSYYDSVPMCDLKVIQ
jgi:hypothetical protein